MDILSIVMTVIIGLGVPAIGFLFKQFTELRAGNEKLREAQNLANDKLSEVKMMIYRDYVSMAHMEKIMAPFQKDVNNLERLIERIASRLSIPAVLDE